MNKKLYSEMGMWERFKEWLNKKSNNRNERRVKINDYVNQQRAYKEKV